MPVTVVGASAGPVITRFEVEPALGVRGSRIVGLIKDLSRGLGLTSIRVVETIPGKTCMGLELPNAKRQMIRLSEILEADVYRSSKTNLTIAMGKDIIGNPGRDRSRQGAAHARRGHDGFGQVRRHQRDDSVAALQGEARRRAPIMIAPEDAGTVGLQRHSAYARAGRDRYEARIERALNWCVGGMEKRYRLMSAVGVRNLQDFNQKVGATEAAGKKLTNPFSLTPDAPEPLSTLPMIVVVIDELADLMMVAGIHLILATQRPSVDVITGLIKANIPTRVAFQVSSKIDSRTILDQIWVRNRRSARRHVVPAAGHRLSAACVWRVRHG